MEYELGWSPQRYEVRKAIKEFYKENKMEGIVIYQYDTHAIIEIAKPSDVVGNIEDEESEPDESCGEKLRSVTYTSTKGKTLLSYLDSPCVDGSKADREAQEKLSRIFSEKAIAEHSKQED